MWNIFGRYKGKKVLPSARQMNLIAAILNHVTQGTGISMSCPQNPSTDAPWVIGVDTSWLKEFVGGSSTIASNSLAGSDGNGNLTALLALLTTAPTRDKVLSVARSGTSLSWEDAGPQNPSSKTSLTVAGEGAVAAQSNSWTFGGTNGVDVTLQTRTFYDHTATTPVLYGYYRTFTFDRNGKLYSISTETRYVIDQPVVGNITT